jgi:transposase
MLAHVDDLDADIVALGQRIEAAVAPFAREVELLCTIPGVGRRSAEVILAEIGTVSVYNRMCSSAYDSTCRSMYSLTCRPVLAGSTS